MQLPITANYNQTESVFYISDLSEVLIINSNSLVKIKPNQDIFVRESYSGLISRIERNTWSKMLNCLGGLYATKDSRANAKLIIQSFDNTGTTVNIDGTSQNIVVGTAITPVTSYITTTNFSRTPTAVATTIQVTITVNGVPTVESITKNANGEVLRMVSVDEDINAITDYIPAGGTTVYATKTQSRIATGGVQQNRTVTYNASNEIITIGLWA
jgi:hypothetical protein